jgi:hypothetical protein
MRIESNISCEAALELMSPFIDSMVSVGAADSLQSHLSNCKSCKRQLQSFISLRNVIAGVEPVPVPEDLQLETRVRLSHARLHNRRDRWQAGFDNILRPFAMPAVMGVILTLLGFGILFGGLTAPRQVIASEDGQGVFVAGIYQPPTTMDSTLRRLGGVSPELDNALSVQFELNTVAVQARDSLGTASSFADHSFLRNRQRLMTPATAFATRSATFPPRSCRRSVS